MRKTALLLSIFILFLFVSDASARTLYTIKKGDNLHDIAKKFHVNQADLEKANKVNAKNLKPGSRIVIPVERKSSKAAKASAKKKSAGQVKEAAASGPAEPEQTEAAPQPRAAAPEKAAVKAAPALDDNKYHTVRKGDTLRTIAKKYGVPVSDIRNLNDLHKPKLRTGQKLLVKLAGPKIYTVKKGDNLWRIARKFDMDADDLMEMNEMSSPVLKVGQKLYLEEKPAVVNVDQKYIVMARNIEEELKMVPESPEFAEKSSQDRLAVFAKKLLNIPYRFGGNTILGIDCSAYVKKVYGLMGVTLPRTAREQFLEGQEIEKEELSVGDLVFFRTYASFPSHVGIYLGNNLFIHASSKGKKVTIDNLETPYYLKRFIGAKRLISASEENKEPSADPS